MKCFLKPLLLVMLAAAMWGVTITAEAQIAPKPIKDAGPPTLVEAMSKQTKYKAEAIEKVLKAFGPAFAAQLKMGKQVELEGVGTFRVVRISEYRDQKDGRPITVPARSFVEFVASGTLDAAANSPGAVPAREIQGYDFIVQPNASPGIRTPGTREPGIRTPTGRATEK